MMLPEATWLNAYCVSRENVKSQKLIVLKYIFSRFSENIESISIRNHSTFIMNTSSKKFCEVMSYDPVRHTALYIGLSPPHPDCPLHWLIYRSREATEIVSILKGYERDIGVDIPPYTFEEALDIIRKMDKEENMFKMHRGMIVISKDDEEMIKILEEVIGDESDN